MPPPQPPPPILRLVVFTKLQSVHYSQKKPNRERERERERNKRREKNTEHNNNPFDKNIAISCLFIWACCCAVCWKIFLVGTALTHTHALVHKFYGNIFSHFLFVWVFHLIFTLFLFLHKWLRDLHTHTCTNIHTYVYTNIYSQIAI